MPRIYGIVLDETEYWNEGIVQRAGKIFGVYFYNPKEVYHCCELTPSYELYFMGSFSQEYPEDELEQETLYDDIIVGDMNTELIKYFHCKDINKIPLIKRGSVKEGRFFYASYNKKDLEFEDILEDYRCNPVY